MKPLKNKLFTSIPPMWSIYYPCCAKGLLRGSRVFATEKPWDEHDSVDKYDKDLGYDEGLHQLYTHIEDYVYDSLVDDGLMPRDRQYEAESLGRGWDSTGYEDSWDEDDHTHIDDDVPLDDLDDDPDGGNDIDPDPGSVTIDEMTVMIPNVLSSLNTFPLPLPPEFLWVSGPEILLREPAIRKSLGVFVLSEAAEYYNALLAKMYRQNGTPVPSIAAFECKTEADAGKTAVCSVKRVVVVCQVGTKTKELVVPCSITKRVSDIRVQLPKTLKLHKYLPEFRVIQVERKY